MSAAELLGLLKDFGFPGLFVGFLIWDKLRLDAKWRRIEEQRLAQEKELEERRLKVDDARIETDKQMVLALQALTFQVNGRPQH